MFSILIPSWNNLPYLKLCIEGIRRHSALAHEIIVHVNDGSDGTLEWVRSQGIRHTWSAGNVGVCLALNDAARLATCDTLLYLNDDMYCTPGWDIALDAARRRAEGSFVYLAANLIEPVDTGNAQVMVADFGRTPDDFDADGLCAFAAAVGQIADRDGIALQPMLISRRLWQLVGGYSIEFGPGMSSDDDFLMKLWLVGCRTFRVVGGARVYHFSCATTRRVRRNRGGRAFLLKWGITQQAFVRGHVRASMSGGRGRPPAAIRSGWLARMKRALYAFRGHPTADLYAWEPDLPAQLGRVLETAETAETGEKPGADSAAAGAATTWSAARQA